MEDEECDLSEKYANLVVWTVLTTMFSNIFPLGTFLTFFYVCLQILVDRCLILRRFKQPLRLSINLSFKLAEYCDIIPVFYMGGNLYFRWLVEKRFDVLEIGGLVVAVCFWGFPKNWFFGCLGENDNFEL
jgi:hypothetical protein